MCLQALVEYRSSKFLTPQKLRCFMITLLEQKCLKRSHFLLRFMRETRRLASIFIYFQMMDNKGRMTCRNPCKLNSKKANNYKVSRTLCLRSQSVQLLHRLQLPMVFPWVFIMISVSVKYLMKEMTVDLLLFRALVLKVRIKMRFKRPYLRKEKKKWKKRRREGKIYVNHGRYQSHKICRIIQIVMYQIVSSI